MAFRGAPGLLIAYEMNGELGLAEKGSDRCGIGEGGGCLRFDAEADAAQFVAHFAADFVLGFAKVHGLAGAPHHAKTVGQLQGKIFSGRASIFLGTANSGS